jgi:hypothetical protein
MNALAAVVGLVTLAIGIGWLIYERVVNLEVPYFAIPLVLTVPVIAAAAVRCIWD